MLEALLEREPERFDAHVNLARSLARAGRYQDAERHLRRALEQRPEDGEVHYLLGLMLARLGRLDEAIEALEAALRYRARPRAGAPGSARECGRSRSGAGNGAFEFAAPLLVSCQFPQGACSGGRNRVAGDGIGSPVAGDGVAGSPSALTRGFRVGWR